MGDQAEKLRL